MGGGVSKDLIEENKRLKRLVKELNDEIKKQASQSSSDDNLSSSKVTDQRSTIISDSPPKKNAGVITRRGEVSAEVREISGLITNYEKVNIKKSSDIRQLLITAVEESLLFNSMGEEEKSECVDAFIEQKYKCGDSIIKQNDVGNDFYIIGTGTVEVLLKTLGSKGYLSKGHLSKGQSFGELALLYNTPRAATIIAQTDVALWVLSRQTFVTISTYFKHQRLLKYQTFLQEVDVFKSMKKKQLLRVAEALEPEKHAAGDAIILQGEKGNHFYLIAKGTVKYQVTNAETKEVKDVGSGTIGNFCKLFQLLGLCCTYPSHCFA
jgi:cAMP-dependent protein kinase regulator